MAFDVTPTSGEGPYTFTASFLNKGSFNHGYNLQFRTVASVQGSCPPVGAQSSVQSGAGAEILQNGSYVRESPVADGYCAAFVLRITSPSGSQVSEQRIDISNVE